MTLDSLCDCHTTPHLTWCITHKIDALLVEVYLHAASIAREYAARVPETENTRLNAIYTGQKSAAHSICNAILEYAK